MTPASVEALKSKAEEAIEDGVYAARRAVQTGRREFERMGRRVEDLKENLEDLKDETVHQVKRHPLAAVGAAAGIGMVLGMAVGWFASGMRRRT
jgi:ElaB/YqjD/DUF883 family membrane-anchored ribosome-binding protein